MWDETQNIMLELFEQVWGPKNQISVDNIVDLTVPVGTFLFDLLAELTFPP